MGCCRTDLEEMSLKTGSFKKFPLFLKMLSTALSRSSDTVFLDLLTQGDLEILKQKKLQASSSAPFQQTSSHTQREGNKRYMIVTYVGEFDK